MTSLDSRTWLTWGCCCMVPLLISRHPAIILELLLLVITVRFVCLPQAAMRWRWIIRVALLFAVVGVVFNALTVRTGNQVAFDVIGWSITWNAIVYGLVSGVAMITLVLTGITTAAGLDWIALTRVLPGRLAPLAVSGSVAWSFLPGASQALGEIREAQAARGHHIRSGRDVLPIIVPLLDGSLGRALTMSEALEARGFGASGDEPGRTSRWTPVWGTACILGVLSMAYAISLGDQRLILPAVGLSIIGVIGILRSPQPMERTTRYREHQLQVADRIVIATALAALIMFLSLAAGNFDSITFNPYPDLELPALDFRLLLALFLLLTPAFFPASGRSQ